MSYKLQLRINADMEQVLTEFATKNDITEAQAVRLLLAQGLNPESDVQNTAWREAYKEGRSEGLKKAMVRIASIFREHLEGPT